MALLVTENGAYDAVNSNAGTGGTTITVLTSALWPDPATVGPYGISVWPSAVAYDNSIGERCVVTGKSGAVLTVVRAQASTTAKTIAIGWQIAKGWGAEEGRAGLWTPDRNLLMNPGFFVCQRGASHAIASLATAGYGPDGWYSLNQSNPVSYGRTATTATGICSPYTGVYTQINASSQRFGILQPIEYLRSFPLRGEPVRLDFQAGASTTLTLRYAILCWVGTADSPTKNPVNDWTSSNYTAGNFFINTSWNITAVGSLSIPGGGASALCSLRATVHASTTNIAIFLWTEAVAATSVAIGVSDFMLAPETQWRPFVARDGQRELALCQRFYEKSYNQATAPATASVTAGLQRTQGGFTDASGFFTLPVTYAVQKRVAPTVTLYDFAGNSGKITEFNSSGGGTTDNVTPSGGTVGGERGFYVPHDPSGNIDGLMAHFTATSEL